MDAYGYATLAMVVAAAIATVVEGFVKRRRAGRGSSEMLENVPAVVRKPAKVNRLARPSADPGPPTR